MYHGVAAGLIFGEAGEAQFDDAIVARADLIALRARIDAVIDDTIDKAAVDVTVTLKDSRKIHVFVKNAIGSLERPMSMAQLDAKFDGLVVPVLGAEKSDALKEICWQLATERDVSALVGHAIP